MTNIDSYIDSLVQKSIFTLREAKSRFKNIGILWSGGKDSTTTLSLCRAAFFNTVPFPVIHIDNGIDFPETYAFRDQLVSQWKLRLLVAKSEIKEDDISGVSCCGHNKTEALKRITSEHGFDALIVSIRRDEHGIRAKERVFSPRDSEWEWKYKNQPLEMWDNLIALAPAEHYRVHPILHWRETDVWNYMHREDVPLHPLYFSRNGMRFRSLGCTRCTVAVESDAKNISAILNELDQGTTSERAGRAQDKEGQAIMERLRALGYM